MGRARRLALGLGLLTKFSILFVATGILVGIVLTPMRRALVTPWPWTAAAIALILGSPSITGQIVLHYPVVAQMRDLGATQLAHVTWLSFVSEQVLMIGPVPFAVAVAGALALTPIGTLAFGLIALPISLPILSPAATAAYAERTGAAPALRDNRGEVDRLPQDFADMLGWEEQARTIAAVYRSLPPDEQRDAVIGTGNYGKLAPRNSSVHATDFRPW